jgi:hypothetical protein
MKRFTSIGLSILVLAGVMIGGTVWLQMFTASVQAYQSPLHDTNLTSLPSSAVRHNKVVIVLISGLGYDTALDLELPVLEQLKQVGVFAAVESSPPTFSQTAWATLLSGASPETNDAPPIDIPRENLRLLQVDTLFARAHAAQLKTALLGSAEWRRLIPRNQLDYAFFANESGPEGERDIVEAALSLIADENIELMLIHFDQLNLAGRLQGGPNSPAYQAVAIQIDAYLGQIRNALDLNQTTLVVVSDHGQIGSGGFGGAEPDVIWQPLVMVGGNTVSGSYSDIHQTDIAPTLAALMGIPSPGAAQGRILYEMLQLDKEEQAAAQILLAQQRVALAQAYARQIQGEEVNLPNSMGEGLLQAQTAFDRQNLGGAFELALLTQQVADEHMAAVRYGGIWSARWPRLIFAGFVLVFGLVILWRRRGPHAGSVLVAAAATIILYHALYQLQGNSYSVSSLHALGFAELVIETSRRVAVSLLAGGGLMLIFFMLTDEKNWLTLLGTGYGFCVLVTFAFVALFFWGYWQNGWQVTWHLPDIEAVFWQITGALEAVSAAALGLVLPWPIMGLSLLVNLTRQRLSQAQTRGTSGSNSLPGLRL